jgi:uncharacterized protein involved in exopolysaccharide biosynthesis
MTNENTIEKDDEIDIRELILVLLKNWKIIAITTVLITIGVIIFAAITPNQYVVKTVAVTGGGTSGGSQMAGLAALAGINISSGVSEVNLVNYIDLIIENTPFNEQIIEQEWIVRRLQTKKEMKERAPFIYDTITLAQFWEFDEPDTTVLDWEYRFKMGQVGMLRNPKKKFITIEKDVKTGTIEIKTRFENPSLSFAVHQFLVEFLKSYIEEDKLNRGKENRKFVEERVAETRENLNRAEMRLANFRERNLTAQSPNIILEGERLAREVALQANVYAELVKQLELARIDEKKEATAFEIIKQADLPLYPAEPNRKLLFVIGFMGGVFAGVFGVFAKEWVLSIKNVNKNA